MTTASPTCSTLQNAVQRLKALVHYYRTALESRIYLYP
jgi:hypothetical protein